MPAFFERVLKDYERYWPSYPKDVVNELTDSSGRQEMFIALEIDELSLYLGLSVGPRKGIREKVVVIDQKEPIACDRVRVAETTWGVGKLLSLVEIRNQISREKRDPFDVCREYIQRILDDIRSNPDLYRIIIRQLDNSTRSMEDLGSVFPGGAPGLGKRR